MVRSSIRAQKLNRSCLHHERPESLQSKVIIKLSHIKLQRRHVEVTVSEPGHCLIETEHILCVIVAESVLWVHLEVGTLSENVLNFPLDRFDLITAL